MPRKAEDLSGKKFNHLKALYRDENLKKWVCECDCGNITYVNSTRLKNGRIKSCGCLQHQLADDTDFIGRRFGLLTVLYRDINNIKKYICKCDCGNSKSIDRSSLIRGFTNSCGCLQSKIASEKFTKDLTGCRFGRLVVIERNLDKPKSKGVYWKCVCDCGNTVDVLSQLLTNGATKSCGCLKSELTSKNLSYDLIGKQFGRLTVVERCENYILASNIQYSQWLCKCECGSIKKVIGRDLVKSRVCSCGCLISKGEETIRIELNKRNISFVTQYWFDDLRSDKNYPLKFDFAIIDKDNDTIKCLIEYQGEQHFDDYDRGYFGKQQREVTDRLKKDYCENNNIKLYEICYNENIIQRLEEILNSI